MSCVHTDYKQCIIRSTATWYTVLYHRSVRDSTTDSQASLITSVQIYVVVAVRGNTAGIILVTRITFLLIMTNVYNSHI